MLASQVLHAGEREENRRLDHTLDGVMERELGIAVDKAERRSDWSKAVLTPEQLAYAAADARHLARLAADLGRKLAEENLSDTVALEMRALAGIAWAGPIAVDSQAWLDVATDATSDRDRLEAEMDALASNPGTWTGTRNWHSPEEVLAAFRSVGVKLFSTDGDTLAGIDHPLAALLRDHRAAAKRARTYRKKWLAEHVVGGTVLPSWRQLGAESGRMSCSGPNLQQVPRGSDYRRCFVARPGHVLVKGDYSQIELRIAAKIATETGMIAAYLRGEDLHTLTAATLTGKKTAEVTKPDRQLAKAINFGLLFGMGAKSLKGYAKSAYGVGLTDEEAKRYRDAFFRSYPGLARWHAEVRGGVKRLYNSDPTTTHVVKTVGGRRRILPVAARKTDGTTYLSVNDALNTPVQGTGADGLKAAIGLLWERRYECPGAVPPLFCHDEVVVEVPET